MYYYLFIFFTFIGNRNKQKKMLKKVKYSLLFVSGKKRVYRLRVLTVIVSAKRAVREDGSQLR